MIKNLVDLVGLDYLLDYLNDLHQEDKLLVSLVRKGWVKEDGTLAKDLMEKLPEAVEKAFDETEMEKDRTMLGEMGTLVSLVRKGEMGKS